MAVSCLLRIVSKSFQGCSRQYIIAGQLLKSGSALSSSELKHVYTRPVFIEHKQNVAVPLLQNCNQKYCSNLQQMNFSASSKLQSKESGNYTTLWSAERILAISLLGILPGAFLIPSQPMDCILAMTLVMHNHWGIEAVVVDYVRPIIFGPVVPKIAHGLVYVMSIATLVGLFYLTFNGCGIVNTIKLIWKL